MKRIYLFFLMLFLASGFCFTSAQAVEYEQNRITNSTAKQEMAKISYQNIIWHDWRSDADGRWQPGGGADKQNKVDLYFYDLSTKRRLKLTSDKDKVEVSDVTESYVFWLDSGAEPGIHYYDIQANKKVYAVAIPEFPSYTNYGGTYLAAYANEVVYSLAGQSGIFHYKEGNLNKKVSDIYINGLDLGQKNLVFTSTEAQGSKVYYYDLNSDRQKIISAVGFEAANFDNNIALGGNKVIWQKGGEKTDLVYYNLTTGQRKVLTRESRRRLYPGLSENYAVWQTYNPKVNDYQVAFYDFETEKVNVNSKIIGFNPDVDEQKIVFHGRNKARYDIYLLDPQKLVIKEPAEPVVPGEPEIVFPDGLVTGDLIKLKNSEAVYYLGADGKKYVFPNVACYFTWYEDFSKIKTVDYEDFSKINIGGNVTYRPGVKLIKLKNDNKVFAVSQGGVRRWISTPDLAIEIFGESWTDLVEVIPNSFWVNYTEGEVIKQTSDYDLTVEKQKAKNINQDKQLL